MKTTNCHQLAKSANRTTQKRTRSTEGNSCARSNIHINIFYSSININLACLRVCVCPSRAAASTVSAPKNVDTLMKENNLICIYQMRKSNKCYLQYKIPNNTILPMQTPGTTCTSLSTPPYKRWLFHLNNKLSFLKLFRNSFLFRFTLSHFPYRLLRTALYSAPVPPFRLLEVFSLWNWTFHQCCKEKRNK